MITSTVVNIGVCHSLGDHVTVIIGVDRRVGVAQCLSDGWVVGIFQIYCNVC